jgi:hypothetical protein
MSRDTHYDKNVTVDTSHWDAALELTIWAQDHVGKDRVIRIPVEEIPDFMAYVVQHGARALSIAAKRIEVGHCETCGNVGLVDKPGPGGRMSNEYCPDCRGRWPAEPFKSAPTIGRKQV